MSVNGLQMADLRDYAKVTYATYKHEPVVLPQPAYQKNCLLIDGYT